MSKLKTFEVRLTTRGTLFGEVEAVSEEDAIKRTFDLWCNASPHPFQQHDHELTSVIVEEVRS
jgi:hypothetical protein